MLTPRPYQQTGRDFLAARRHALLADEMRVGKTPQAILACAAVDAQRVLVIGPAISVPMWQRQIPRWYAEALGKPAPLRAVYSYEGALLRKHEILAERWDVAIIDEAHMAGNPEAQRTRMIFEADGIGSRADHLWLLSGTPAPKHAGSLWPMLTHFGVIDMDYGPFIKRYCRIDYLSQQPKGTKEEMIPELRALWQQIGLRRTRREVAPEMPDIGYEFMEMDPVKGVDIADPGEDFERQADVNREDRVQVALAKAGQLVEHVEFALGNYLLKQTVIFGWHLDALRKVVSCLRAMGFRTELIAGETSSAQRVRIEEQFAQGQIDAVAGQIRACGTAISLPCQHGFFLELDWVPGNNVQAASRLVMIGENMPVTMDICTWPGSTDDKVQRVLLRRARELAKLF